MFFSREHIGDEDREIISGEAIDEAAVSIRLTMNTVDFRRTLGYSINGENYVFITLSKVDYLCDEGLSKGKRFTGALVGMYAYGGKDRPLTVKFTDPVYKDIMM